MIRGPNLVAETLKEAGTLLGGHKIWGDRKGGKQHTTEYDYTH